MIIHTRPRPTEIKHTRPGDEVAISPHGGIWTADEWTPEIAKLWLPVLEVTHDDQNGESVFVWGKDPSDMNAFGGRRQRVWRWDEDPWMIRERIEIDPWDVDAGPRQCVEDRPGLSDQRNTL